jgi:hypothetical protein
VTSREAFRLARIDKSPSIAIDGAFTEIPPRGTATLTVSVDTRTLTGRYRGSVMLYGEGAETPDSAFALTGEILPPLSVEPRSVVFLVANRGEELSKAIDLVNHEESPLAITEVRHASDRFSTKIETLEDGRRYRLHIAINKRSRRETHRLDRYQDHELGVTGGRRNRQQLSARARLHLSRECRPWDLPSR